MYGPIRIGISKCLLGAPVRYDGQHKRDPYLVDTLGSFVEYVPVCPEVECGLPVPRETMRLVGDPASPRLVTHNTKQDKTDQMLRWVQARLKQLEKEDLAGFIFKTGSPSSGMVQVKIYDEDGVVRAFGAGLFARAFMDRFPLLPVEDNGRLHDPDLRENFIQRVFTLYRYRAIVRQKPSASALMKFHGAHKYLIMSHSQAKCRELGRLVAHAGQQHALDGVLAPYEELLLRTLSLQSTRPKHVNVMQHMLGYFRTMLSQDEKQELVELIERYRDGHIPLIVPVTLLNHYVRKYQEPYLLTQYYLHPHPTELQLRNHA